VRGQFLRIVAISTFDRHAVFELLATLAYSWMEIECNRCKTRASIPLDAIRRPRDTTDLET
jgi:hypothetical protein